ncbi:dynamin family protein [Lacinutrix undariae]
MNTINDDIHKEYEELLQSLNEFFLKLNLDFSDSIYRQLDTFHEHKNKIEEYEKSINARTRPLRIGFVGGFSTGKSSIINSLLGEEVLGVKLEPATAQITELSYGRKFEILEVIKNGDGFDYVEISLDEYKKKSTSRSDKNKDTSHYIIKYPSENLSRFTIVDTPGFSSTSKEDDELTKKWIETLDLLIWIFDANKVGDKTEYDKLKSLGSNIKIIGVINKIDTKSPNVREKIRREILHEELLDEVFLYSSKKVLEEFKVRELFNEALINLTTGIKECINRSENFTINNDNLEVKFNSTNSNQTYFSLVSQKKSRYTKYYNELIDEISNVRDNEISLILNKRLVEKRNDFREGIKTNLLKWHKALCDNPERLAKEIKVKEDLLTKSDSIYESLFDDFKIKLEVNFKIFKTSFFNSLEDFLFYKHIEKSVFSDDVYIDMLDVFEEETDELLSQFISNEFIEFLESSYGIYDAIIKKSIYKDYTKVDKIRGDEYHNINYNIKGLVSSSMDSVQGYWRNFEIQKTDSYLEALKFHKENIDFVVPDELLHSSIFNLLIDDLRGASISYNSTLNVEIEKQRTKKNEVLKIVKMLDVFLKKIN